MPEDQLPDDPSQLTKFILNGSFINCNGKNYTCENYAFEEQFPQDANKVFFEKGWRRIGDEIFCPDCLNRNKGFF